jgi:hypothetical protein
MCVRGVSLTTDQVRRSPPLPFPRRRRRRRNPASPQSPPGSFVPSLATSILSRWFWPRFKFRRLLPHLLTLATLQNWIGLRWWAACALHRSRWSEERGLALVQASDLPPPGSSNPEVPALRTELLPSFCSWSCQLSFLESLFVSWLFRVEYHSRYEIVQVVWTQRCRGCRPQGAPSHWLLFHFWHGKMSWVD